MRPIWLLTWLVALSPVWGAFAIGTAIMQPSWRPYLALPLFVVCGLVCGRFGILVERYLLPLIRKDTTEKPWVPIHTVVLDVARAIEDAQANPRSRWFWMNLRGEASFDYVKLADVAVQAAARSSFDRRRSAAIRKTMGS